MNLPKQWLHWAWKMRLCPESRAHKYDGLYLIGRGRRWRVNARGHFEVSTELSDFDRWANSTAASLPMIPTTEAEFRAAVASLPDTTRLSSTVSGSRYAED